MKPLLLLGFFALYAYVIPIAGFSFYTLSFVDIAIVGILFTATKDLLFARDIRFSVTRQWSVLFLGAIAVSALLSGIVPLASGRPEMIVQYFKTLFHFYYFLLIPLILIVYPVKESTWDSCMRLMLIMSIFINTFGIYQVFARAFDLPFAWIEYSTSVESLRSADLESGFSQLSLSYGSFFRATSIFSEPSAFASNIIIFLSLQLAPYALGLPQFFKSKGLNILILTLSLVGLLMTFSLTGAVGLAVLILGLLFITRSARLFKLSLLAIPIVGILLLADGLIESNLGVSVLDLFSLRIGGVAGVISGGSAEIVAGESFLSRVELFFRSYEIWLSSPVIGIGIGLTAFNDVVEIAFADTSFMSALSEMGLLGGVSLTMIFVTLISKLYQYTRPKTRIAPETKRLCCLALFLVLNYAFVSYFTGNILVYYCLWFILGFAYSISQSAGRQLGERQVLIKNND